MKRIAEVLATVVVIVGGAWISLVLAWQHSFDKAQFHE